MPWHDGKFQGSATGVRDGENCNTIATWHNPRYQAKTVVPQPTEIGRNQNKAEGAPDKGGFTMGLDPALGLDIAGHRRFQENSVTMATAESCTALSC
mmetsp:Transcript_98971/g.166707  ORF Transcript_98971/g.166707 Transcript_98971/m.166707 type:complete len:97 (-) Transcript_98971:21-311(-)